MVWDVIERHDVVCRLCLGSKPLQESHIIPRWIWKPLKADEGWFYGLFSEQDSPERKLQDGPKELLLCWDCEQQIGKYERYVRQLLYGKPEEGDTGLQKERFDDGIRLSGIDYTRFKLFQLSLIWRMHESSLDMFKVVGLGDHAERIRKMLHEKRPGRPYEYGCFLGGVLEKPGKPLDNLVFGPDIGRFQGQLCYRIIMSGLIWRFVVSSNSNELPSRKFFIDQEGVLIVPLKLWSEMDFFGRRARQFRTKGII